MKYNAEKIHKYIIIQLHNNNSNINILEILKSMKPELIKSLLEYENNIEIINCLVPTACAFNFTDLVIWLIDNEFYYYPEKDKIQIVYYNNQKLINYYKNLGIKFN